MSGSIVANETSTIQHKPSPCDYRNEALESSEKNWGKDIEQLVEPSHFNLPNRELLQCDVMDELIEGALHECGINAAERLQSLHSHTRGKGYRMLLSNTDVKSAFRKSTNGYSDDVVVWCGHMESVKSRKVLIANLPVAKLINASTTRHSGSDAADCPVVLSQVDERVGKYRGERERLLRGFLLHA